MKWQKSCHCVSYTSDISLNSYEFLTSNSSKIRFETIRYYSNKNIMNAIQMSIVKCQTRICIFAEKMLAILFEVLQGYFTYSNSKLFQAEKERKINESWTRGLTCFWSPKKTFYIKKLNFFTNKNNNNTLKSEEGCNLHMHWIYWLKCNRFTLKIRLSLF